MKTRACLVALVVSLVSATSSLAQVPDLGSWDRVWLKTKVKEKTIQFRAGGPGTDKDNFGGSVYVQVHTDTGTPGVVGLDVWVREDAWEKRSIAAVYVGGTADDLLLVANQVPVSPDPVTEPMLHFGMAVRLTAKAAAETVTKGTLKTLGGYVVEVDDVPGSDLRAGGSVSLSGVVTTKVPADLPLE
jgi:hypothetical protein